MRGAWVGGLAVALLLGGCHRSASERPGPNVPDAPSTHEAYAAQQLTEQAFEQAEKAKVQMSKSLDDAQRAQQDAADAEHQVALDQSKLADAKGANERQDAQKKLHEDQQKLSQAQSDAQQKTQAARQAQANAQVADHRYQALSRAVQATVVHPQVPTRGDGVAVEPGTVGPLQTAEGKVAAVADGQLTLQTQQQKLTLTTDGTTQVNLDGRLVKLKQLPSGLDARVAYTPGQPPVARRIDASSLNQEGR